MKPAALLLAGCFLLGPITVQEVLQTTPQRVERVTAFRWCHRGWEVVLSEIEFFQVDHQQLISALPYAKEVRELWKEDLRASSDTKVGAP